MSLRTLGCIAVILIGLAAPAAAQQSPAPTQPAPAAVTPAAAAPVQPVAAASTSPAQPSGRMSPLSVAGLTMFAMGYYPSLAIGVGYLVIVYPFQYLIMENNPEPALLWLMLPCAGPFLGANTEIMRGEYGWQAFYVGLGVVQTVGLLLWATALFDGHNDPAPTQAGLHVTQGRNGPALSVSW